MCAAKQASAESIVLDFRSMVTIFVNNPNYVIDNIVDVSLLFYCEICARFKVGQSHFRFCVTCFYFESEVPVETRSTSYESVTSQRESFIF